MYLALTQGVFKFLNYLTLLEYSGSSILSIADRLIILSTILVNQFALGQQANIEYLVVCVRHTLV